MVLTAARSLRYRPHGNSVHGGLVSFGSTYLPTLLITNSPPNDIMVLYWEHMWLGLGLALCSSLQFHFWTSILQCCGPISPVLYLYNISP